MSGVTRSNGQGVGGQALVEFALVAPLVVLLVGGIVVFGVGVFYQQQLTNAARQAARYAAIHSTTADYWVDSNRVPAYAQPEPYDGTNGWGLADRPPTAGGPIWQQMTSAGREATFGIDREAVQIAACWSGFWSVDALGLKVSEYSYDAMPPTASPAETKWFDCHIGGIDPKTNAAAIPCPPPATSVADDEGSAVPGNAVTVYACYEWIPPLAGLLVLPDSITLRAVVTEVIHRQQ